MSVKVRLLPTLRGLDPDESEDSSNLHRSIGSDHIRSVKVGKQGKDVLVPIGPRRMISEYFSGPVGTRSKDRNQILLFLIEQVKPRMVSRWEPVGDCYRL